MVLTVNGRPGLVVQDPESYHLIPERLERAETVAAIRRGMQDVEPGRTITIEEAAAKLRSKHGL